MSDRDVLLQGLKLWPDAAGVPASDPRSTTPLEDPLGRFIERMEAVRGEVIVCRQNAVSARIADWLQAAGAARLMAGSDARLDPFIAGIGGRVDCLRQEQDMETVSDLLFNAVDAGLSHCEAAIAETGSLVIASSPVQPRAISLVPPLHVALLPRSALLDDVSTLLAGCSGGRLPANLLLISGPSKSADIEQVLAYGVHGPKRLLTVIYD